MIKKITGPYCGAKLNPEKRQVGYMPRIPAHKPKGKPYFPPDKAGNCFGSFVAIS